MTLLNAKRYVSLLVLLLGISTSEAAQKKEPVAWVLSNSGSVGLVQKADQTTAPLYPTQSLFKGDNLFLNKNESLSLLVLADKTRRVYRGPANLQIRGEAVSVRSGKLSGVFPLPQAQFEIAEQWIASRLSQPAGNGHDNSRPVGDPDLMVFAPLNGATLLNNKPEFVFHGDLPRDSTLVIFDNEGKRFWVQAAETQRVTFPPAAEFNWGQAYSWELRKRTGGKVITGVFQIASEHQANNILNARVVNKADTRAEDLLFYAARLELLGAYKEANQLWLSLGVSKDQLNRPEPVK